MSDLHEQIVRDLITRTEVAVDNVMSVAHQTGIVFEEDDVVDSVERALPEGYPTPADGPEPRRQIIRNIVRDIISGDLYEDEAADSPVPDLDDLPAVSLVYRKDGWILPDYSDYAQCGVNNHQPDAPQCTDTAVWQVVENHGMHQTLTWWCATHLPDKYRPADPTG